MIEFSNIRTVCGEKVADMTVKHSELKAIDVPASHAPAMIDEYPILSIAASFTKALLDLMVWKN